MSEEPFFTSVVILIGLVALAGLVYLHVQPRAASVTRQNSVSSMQRIGPQLESQQMTQVQGELTTSVGYPGPSLPPDNASLALLTPGSISVPLLLDVEFSDVNGVPNAIQQPNAVFIVVASYGKDVKTNCNQNDGTTCWASRFDGSDLSVVTAASPAEDEVDGHFRVPITLPYFAHSGIWTLYWSITPVNEYGLLQPDLALTNKDALMRFTVGGLMSMDVTTSLHYTIGGQPMKPGFDSDPVAVEVMQQGNEAFYVFAYGEDWLCSSGRRMPADTTKISGVSSGWSDADSFSLRKGLSNKIRITGEGGADWIVPQSQGNMLGEEYFLGQNIYSTRIHVPDGISGTCTSTIMNIAAQIAS